MQGSQKNKTCVNLDLDVEKYDPEVVEAKRHPRPRRGNIRVESIVDMIYRLQGKTAA